MTNIQTSNAAIYASSVGEDGIMFDNEKKEFVRNYCHARLSQAQRRTNITRKVSHYIRSANNSNENILIRVPANMSVNSPNTSFFLGFKLTSRSSPP
jgi:hypothetical protein